MYRLAAVSVADEIHLFESVGADSLSMSELARKLGISFRATEAMTTILAAFNLLN